MLDVMPATETKAQDADDTVQEHKVTADAPLWQTPKLEDVSEQVMAQPYIRFT
jgi:hypothetical protein